MQTNAEVSRWLEWGRPHLLCLGPVRQQGFTVPWAWSLAPRLQKVVPPLDKVMKLLQDSSFYHWHNDKWNLPRFQGWGVLIGISSNLYKVPTSVSAHSRYSRNSKSYSSPVIDHREEERICLLVSQNLNWVQARPTGYMTGDSSVS